MKYRRRERAARIRRCREPCRAGQRHRLKSEIKQLVAGWGRFRTEPVYSRLTRDPAINVALVDRIEGRASHHAPS